VHERFDLYYAGVFLVDDRNEWAVLRAGTGEAGEKMRQANHRLRVGGSSMIGWCVANGQARIALDVGDEAVHFDNPLLPDTRSEMALPLISRGRVIGAATIQSSQPAAFTLDDATVLQTMADQVAGAVENARLFEQAQRTLDELDTLNRRLTGEAWRSYLKRRSDQAVTWLANDQTLTPLPSADELTVGGAISEKPAGAAAEEALVTVPIALRGQPIGALRFRVPARAWNEDLATIATNIAGHIAQAAENARLIEQTERAAQREAAIALAADRIHRASDLEGVLRTAVAEVSRIVGIDDINIQFGTGAARDGNGRTE
jgi:GAF domain-containing protein